MLGRATIRKTFIGAILLFATQAALSNPDDAPPRQPDTATNPSDPKTNSSRQEPPNSQPDEFKPTESIKADSAIAFPVDI